MAHGFPRAPAESRSIIWSYAAVASCLLLLPLLLPTGGPTDRSRATQQLMQCINNSQTDKFNKSMERSEADLMSSVMVAGAWWSDRPPAVPMTITTQLSFDRLEQLEAQCRSWHGPISAVAYLPLDDGVKSQQGSAHEEGRTQAAAFSTLPQAIDRVRDFHAMTEKDVNCQVRCLNRLCRHILACQACFVMNVTWALGFHI